jgi:quinol monooxygenase YgiN
MTRIRTTATMSLAREDLDEVVGIFRTFIADVHAKDQGVLTYHYFVDDDEDPVRIHVIEEYESARAMLDHFANIDDRAAGRLLELVQLSPSQYFGDPTPEERATLEAFGTVHYHRPLVSIEDDAAPA